MCAADTQTENTALCKSPLKARKTNMPIFLFDWVSARGGRGTGVMHKMTLRLHHTRDSFMVRRCFNHATALEGINQNMRAHTHSGGGGEAGSTFGSKQSR